MIEHVIHTCTYLELSLRKNSTRELYMNFSSPSPMSIKGKKYTYTHIFVIVCQKFALCGIVGQKKNKLCKKNLKSSHLSIKVSLELVSNTNNIPPLPQSTYATVSTAEMRSNINDMNVQYKYRCAQLDHPLHVHVCYIKTAGTHPQAVF